MYTHFFKPLYDSLGVSISFRLDLGHDFSFLLFFKGSKRGFLDKHFDEIECELNGEEFEEPKHNRNLCIDCNVVKTIDYERSTLVCTKCGLCEYYPVYVVSYNHTMQPLRRKYIYKRSDNFKVILNQFFYGGKKLVLDDVMERIKDEIHNETNILYNYTIPITIPILECILKRNELTMYKDSIYFIYFKLSGGYFPHITLKEYNTILNAFMLSVAFMTNTNLMIGRAF